MPRTIIQTARLELRPLVLADLDDLHRLWIDPGVRRYLFDDVIVSRERTAAEIDSSIRSFGTNGYGIWGVRRRDRPALIGFCGFREFHEPPELELFFGIAPPYWSRGFATEAARAVIRYGLEELGFTEIVASADAPNRASLRVMEKAGLKFREQVRDGDRDTVYYGLSCEGSR
jgi:ribosomal-protein-alanine N-acetyltransferase